MSIGALRGFACVTIGGGSRARPILAALRELS